MLLNSSIESIMLNKGGGTILPLLSISSLWTQSSYSRLLQIHCIHSLPVSISWYEPKQWSTSSPAFISLWIFFETHDDRGSLRWLRFVPERDFCLAFSVAASFSALAASLSAACSTFSAAFTFCSSFCFFSVLFQFYASLFLALLLLPFFFF